MRLKKKVRLLLRKSQESSNLAVAVYNNPVTIFRSNGFIVLMNIAWLSLFHAIFENEEIKYYFKDPEDKRRYFRIDGERKTWDLSKCAKEYFNNANDPIYKNIQFFIGLRNKIEHSYLQKPEQFDQYIFGECQSYLMNFEEILVKTFGPMYSLADSLLFALQYSRFRTDEQLVVTKKVQSRKFLDLKKHVDDFRSNLDFSTLSDPKYSFRVFLIQKPANRISTSDAAIEFVNFDSTNLDEMKKYEHLVTLIKEKNVKEKNYIELAKEPTSGSEKYLILEREKKNGIPIVGITNDPKESAGILVREELSNNIFNDAARIVEAGEILKSRVNECPFTKKVLFFIYGEREKIYSEKSFPFLIESNYYEYVPYYYWLIKLKRDDLIRFLENKINAPKHPMIYSIIRLLISIDKASWLNYFTDFCEQFENYSQPPQWFWSFKSLRKATKGKTGKDDLICSALGIRPNDEVFKIKVEELLRDKERVKTLLSDNCIDYASGREVDLSSLRKLDLIAHYDLLYGNFPDRDEDTE